MELQTSFDIFLNKPGVNPFHVHLLVFYVSNTLGWWPLGGSRILKAFQPMTVSGFLAVEWHLTAF